MLIRSLTVIALISFVTACSSKRHQPVVLEEKVQTNIDRTLYLSDISFSKSVADGKFKTECEMLPVLKETILESSQTFALNVIPSNGKVASNQLELKVEYIEVVPHKWTFMAVRPSSNATIKASILKDGTLIHTTTKLIGSGVAFGACGRLEKISVAEGRYISKWVSKHI